MKKLINKKSDKNISQTKMMFHHSSSLKEELESKVNNRKYNIQNVILAWSVEHIRKFPWRSKNRTVYTILISEILLKRTTAKAVTRIYLDFIKRHPSLSEINQAPECELQDVLKKIGLQTQRSASLKSIANKIINDFNGIIPNTRDALLSIPHIGPYSANAILSFGFGKPAAIVDCNVERIIRRIFLHKYRLTSEEITEIADNLLPLNSHELFNWAMLDIGAMFCTSLKPWCNNCPISESCDTSFA